MDGERPVLAMFGCGAMGLPMVRHLVAAGYTVHAWDPDEARLRAAAEAGAKTAPGAQEAVAAAEVVLACLTDSEAFVRAAEETFIPSARPGQVFVDLGTTVPEDTRRIAGRLAEAGASLVDAPVSGGPQGAERADLYVFVGGAEADVARVRPILETIGGAAKLTHGGPVGAGQVLKGVNQLMSALARAAYLEAMAYGVRSGLDPKTVRDAMGSEGRWRSDFAGVAAFVARGQGETVGCLHGELGYFLEHARAAGFEMPLARALHDFCAGGDAIVEERRRRVPSYWRELVKAKRKASDE